ncbi:SMI1/KNR4 family protein [Pontibacillus sp. HMF3514]|uniref:SMI1/KNR4 family protein n=1 Tax=Pontibacillus sp. HMF3514 TaxID=2692425 RepID=UPI0013200412|nr:SMI1/KNR4 family protein [Pontibacillus sp. HMF3514]QHE52768.1 SMI1/KNR4 family protein [Pontibacillus sp. HMF3514]
MYEIELKQLIESRSVHRLKGTSEVKVKEIEDKLNVTLPESYKWLLKEYGSVSFDGMDIDGVGLNDVHISLANTEDWQDYGIPGGYVVIFEPGADWVYCLDTENHKQGECPIVAWYQGQEIGDKEADNLYEFIIQGLDS